MNDVMIIAEAGVNHNGSVDLALRLVDAAAEAGADIVKFQSFVTEKLVTRKAKQAAYQTRNLGGDDGQFSMLKKLELAADAHKVLIGRCKDRGIRFMSTAFDDESIDLLHALGCAPWKVPSGEITNLPYLRRIGSFSQEVIVSTGMATLGEVESALSVLESAGTPRNMVTILHCTTEYPAPLEDVNLRAMITMRDAFGTKVGYSDHTPGIEVAVAAVALGARVIEKHFTLDRKLPGPDHIASLEPNELSGMVRAIRHVETAMGNGIKRPSASELNNRLSARKSIVASSPIAVGEELSPENCTTKRPGTGMSPMLWDEVIGRVSTRAYSVDEMIEI
jgi:N,N'-diacetyllegionaminate synthase